jgi:hypothetical protein
MRVPIYYTVCKIMWKTKSSRGTKEIWIIGGDQKISDLQKNNADWIKSYYFKNAKVKPNVLIQEIISQKQIGTTLRPERDD